MSVARRFGALFPLLLPLGCHSDSDPLDSVGSGATLPVTASSANGTNPSGGSDPTTSGGSDPTTSGGTDSGGTTSGSDTGGPAPTREACDHYLDCVAATVPSELPGAQMGFGPNGTCWDGPPESIEQCIAACQTGWEDLHESFPDETACYLCQEDADCGPGLACHHGDCWSADCGNGIVDADEVCDDGGVLCAEDCSGPGCNPFTNVGCEEGKTCYALQYETECLDPVPDLPGTNEDCTFQDFGPPYCAFGQCYDESNVPACTVEACCAELCNVQDPNSCPAGLVCHPSYFDSPHENYIGACISL